MSYPLFQELKGQADSRGTDHLLCKTLFLLAIVEKWDSSDPANELCRLIAAAPQSTRNTDKLAFIITRADFSVLIKPSAFPFFLFSKHKSRLHGLSMCVPDGNHSLPPKEKCPREDSSFYFCLTIQAKNACHLSGRD